VSDSECPEDSRGWSFRGGRALAALLASVGVYGVLSYAVAQRTREIGIRLALGASSRNVLDSVLGRGVLLIGTGMVVGLAVMLVVVNAAPAFGGLLYEVSPADPVSIVAVALLLGIAGTLATMVPAARATAVDPGSTLRRD
jgi:ABC-type antimicrobial peptide transport system permease subunit